MSQPTQQQYLESRILTASQPQLHLILLEGALRFGRQAQNTWTDENGYAAALPLLDRVADIVEELTQGTASANGKISDELEEQYAFIYRELAACRINQDRAQLDKCLDLLAYQRETWKMACDRLDAGQQGADAVKTPHIPLDVNLPTSGLSLEA